MTSSHAQTNNILTDFALGNAYNGLCLVIVRTKAGEPGAITLRAQSEGLAGAELSLLSAPE
jgi:hypothetical protein